MAAEEDGPESGPARGNTVLRIRTAGPADAPLIADLHCRSWQSAYRGAMSDDYLDRELPTVFGRSWPEKIAAAGADDVVLLAEGGGVVLGFIAVWSELGRSGLGFVDNLHAAPDRRRQGIGRRLMGEAATRLRASGHEGAYLTVLATNQAAIAFYEDLGGRAVDRYTAPVHGHDLDQIKYLWTDLRDLEARARRQ
jgi:ribosomal protein S18 acetylase RimI-like enzyme